jgi:hypothetical protein
MQAVIALRPNRPQRLCKVFRRHKKVCQHLYSTLIIGVFSSLQKAKNLISEDKKQKTYVFGLPARFSAGVAVDFGVKRDFDHFWCIPAHYESPSPYRYMGLAP